MAHVSMVNLTRLQKYWLITGSIAPRPIALITSYSRDGLCNAAPYSSFTYMGEEPPLMVIGIDRYGHESHRTGEMKDTLSNIIERREFVVNMVDEEIVQRTVLCGSDYPAHISEPKAVGFDLAPSSIIQIPRIAQAPIAWECKLFKILDYSKIRSIVLGEIVGMYFRDELFDAEKMRVRVDRYAPFGRLGGPNYCRTTDQISLAVPTFEFSRGVPLV
jgi:flavin reductase (DIM6/NTAB) family NADH-FMN oxidoreductase RutF